MILQQYQCSDQTQEPPGSGSRDHAGGQHVNAVRWRGGAGEPTEQFKKIYFRPGALFNQLNAKIIENYLHSCNNQRNVLLPSLIFQCFKKQLLGYHGPWPLGKHLIYVSTTPTQSLSLN